MSFYGIFIYMPKSNYMSRKNRLDKLIGLLKSQDVCNASNLSKALSISLRTLMRDLRDLEEAGFPIESDRGRGGGIRLHRGWGLGRLQLSYSEILDLLIALATMEKLQPPFLMSNLRSIRYKIALSFPDSQRHNIEDIRKRIWIGDQATSKVLSSFKMPKEKIIVPLRISFFESKQLEIVYIDEKGNSTNRTIEPHFLLFNWPVWHILAWDYLREDIRFFRVDRISYSQLTKESFKSKEKMKFNKAITEFFESV